MATFATALDATSVFGLVPEIPEEAQDLMYLYAMADLWEKGGSRTNLANNYWLQYNTGLAIFIGETREEDDKDIVKDTYR